ncbi:RNA polymerase sigma factor SigF [Streptomycetaceae bacterium NBC_01309]
MRDGSATPGTAPRTAAAPAEAPLDTRVLSRTLLLRLSEVEEGSPEHAYVRSTLVELNLPLVRFAANRFRSRTDQYEDVLQVGTIGLIKAIDRFDPHRGVEFPTYAVPTIIGEIKRFFRDTSWSVRVPRRLQELRLALAEATEEFSHKHDRAPTVVELATHLGMSVEEILEGMEAANAYSPASLDAHDLDDDRDNALIARLGQEDEALDGVEYREALRPLLARMPPRDRQIIMLRFFGNMTQSQIGERLGISQMHVSRLLARALARLRADLSA